VKLIKIKSYWIRPFVNETNKNSKIIVARSEHRVAILDNVLAWHVDDWHEKWSLIRTVISTRNEIVSRFWRFNGYFLNINKGIFVFK
jgi:hypothetical protein